MRKVIYTIIAFAAIGANAFAQDAQAAAAAAAKAITEAPAAEAQVKKPNYWTESLKTNVNFGQTSLSNWAAGGDNTTTLAAYIDANANYKRAFSVNEKSKDMYWNNRLQLDYGFLYASSKPLLQKNTDRIYFESKWGYEIQKKLYFSANFDFKSQFTNGYNYATPGLAHINGVHAGATSLDELSKSEQTQAWKDARVAKSGLLSPAYTNLALGIDWKPNKWFSASFAPLTGGFVIVTDPQFRKNYSMALDCDETDPGYVAALATGDASKIGEYYKGARFEFGAQLKVDAKVNVNDNMSYTTQLVLFSNYLDKPQNARVNWDNRLDWKLAKYFTATVITNLIYDDKVYIGDKRAGIQFKESFALGFTYTFTAKH